MILLKHKNVIFSLQLEFLKTLSCASPKSETDGETDDDDEEMIQTDDDAETDDDDDDEGGQEKKKKTD